MLRQPKYAELREGNCQTEKSTVKFLLAHPQKFFICKKQQNARKNKLLGVLFPT
jgi:hypothetical protein